jgi:hypothetical protein
MRAFYLYACGAFYNTFGGQQRAHYCSHLARTAYNKNGEIRGKKERAPEILSVMWSALGGNKKLFIWEITGVVNRVQ